MTDTVDEAPSACPKCPNCRSEYSYQVGDLKVCTECAHEWAAEAAQGEEPKVPVEGEASQAVALDPAAVIRELKEKGSTLVGKVKVPPVVRKP